MTIGEAVGVAAGTESRKAVAAGPSRRLHVLVVDDSPVLRQVIRRTLMMHFSANIASVSEANDGLSALDRLENSVVDLVVLDVQMPLMSGPDVLEAIRRSPRHARLPIVVVTGTTETDVVSRMLELGIAGYLVKPLSPSVLRERFAEVIARIARRPAVEGEAAAQPRRVVELRPNSRVLIAEQDSDLRRFWIEQLRPLCCVDEVTMSTAALRKHHAAHYDIIIVGQVAGVLNGNAFADKLREMSPFKQTSLVALVAPDGAVAARQSGHYDGVVMQSTRVKEWLGQLGTCLTPESTARLLLAPSSPYVDAMFTKAGELLEKTLKTDVDVLQALPSDADNSGRWFATRVTIQSGATAWQLWLTGKFAFGLALVTASQGFDVDRVSDASVLSVVSQIAAGVAESLREAFQEAHAECRVGTPLSETRDVQPIPVGTTQDCSRWLSAAALDSGAYVRLVPDHK